MNRMKGLTIIQLMITLLVAGIVGKILIDVLIAKRCESQSSIALCVDRKNTGVK
jgi:Tfp pilus assembly protein PilE